MDGTHSHFTDTEVDILALGIVGSEVSELLDVSLDGVGNIGAAPEKVGEFVSDDIQKGLTFISGGIFEAFFVGRGILEDKRTDVIVHERNETGIVFRMIFFISFGSFFVFLMFFLTSLDEGILHREITFFRYLEGRVIIAEVFFRLDDFLS